MTAAGDLIEVQTDTGRWQQAIATAVVSGDTVNCVVYCDGSDWPAASPWNGNGSYLTHIQAYSVAKGSSVGQWRPSSAQATRDAGLLSVPSAATNPGLAAATPRRPSTTRPTLIEITGAWSWSLTAIGTQTGSLTLKSDASTPPTTTIHAASWSRGIGAGITISDTGTEPIHIAYTVLPNEYYQVDVTGGATFTVREQAL